jgi:HlyD family secretion protein
VKWLAFVAAFAACGSPASEGDNPIGASLVLPAPPPPPPRREFTAIIASREITMISAEVEGRVKLEVGLGDRVNAGAVIAELDDAELRAKLEGAKSDEAAAQGEIAAVSGELSQQQHKLDMDKKLESKGIVAPAMVRNDTHGVTQLKGRTYSATARYSAARTRRLEIERQLKATDVDAPNDGVVTLVKVKTGDIVRRGAPIVQLADPDHLWLRFAVPPEVIVRIGTHVEAVLEKGERVRGVVRKLTDTMTPPDHLIIVDVELDDPGRVTLGATGKAWFLDS